MRNLFFVLSLSLVTLSSFSQVPEDVEKGLGKVWFKVLPENESLIPIGASSTRELNPEAISVLIWNIKKTEMPTWSEEFSTFGRNKDLILVQEAYETETFYNTLSEFSGSAWHLGASFFYKRQQDLATGTLIGSKVEPSFTVVKHSPDTEPLLGTPKSATISKFPLAGKNEELMVISIHAINFETTGAFKRHMDQLAEVICAHHGPVLFAGDFNTWNDSRTKYLSRLASKLGMVEAKYENGGDRMAFRGHFLDHIYTRKARVKSAVVVGKSTGSDHKPFLVELSIP